MTGSTATLADAVVVFEVLSDDTAEIDRDDKRHDDAMPPGIGRYVLIEQTHIGALVHTRAGEGWTSEAITEGTIALPEIETELAIIDVYANVAL